MSIDPSAILKTIPLSSPVVEVWAHGLYTGLFFCTVWAILLKSTFGLRDKALLAAVVVLYVNSTIHMAILWQYIIAAFTNHGASPDLIRALTTQAQWFTGLGDTLEGFNTFIADCLFIWRCWVVWGRRWTVVVLPIMACLSGQVLEILNIIGEVNVTGSPHSTISLKFIDLSSTYYGLSLGVSLYTTCMIILRIVFLNLDLLKSGVSANLAKRYARVIEILVESAVLYAANLMAYVILTAQNSLMLVYPANLIPIVAGIASSLIICRVALGYSRADNDWSMSGKQSTITTGIAFAPSPRQDISSSSGSESADLQSHGLALALNSESSSDSEKFGEV